MLSVGNKSSPHYTCAIAWHNFRIIILVRTSRISSFFSSDWQSQFYLIVHEIIGDLESPSQYVTEVLYDKRKFDYLTMYLST